MERVIMILGVLLVFGVCLGPANGQAPVPDGAAEVAWTAPTTYENGQPFNPATDLDHYTVCDSKASGVCDKSINVGKDNLLLITYSPADPETTHYYTVTVTATNGTTSEKSNEASKVIKPPKASGCTITVR